MTRTDQQRLIDSARKHLIQNYRQQPIVLSRGDGVAVWDVKGDRYLDMTSGIAVTCLGHAHPRLVAALSAQAGRLIHMSNLFYMETQIRLAEALCERSFGDRVFFGNSGGEANEAALKLARRYQQVVARAPERTRIIATEGSFHGRTVATVSVTGQEKYRSELGPLWEPVSFVPFDDIEAAEEAVSRKDACAFIVEPLQGEGGLRVPRKGYLRAVRELCSKHGVLLVFDEVQTGVGRTGTWFAYEQEDCAPDVMTLAKGLGGGVPIGCVIATEEAARGLEAADGGPVPHASTFGGNPLACAAALAVIETIETEALLENCRDAGGYLKAGLEHLGQKHPHAAKRARGRGLLLGLEVTVPAGALMTRLRERRLLVTVAGGNVIRFAPALTVSREAIDEALSIFDEVLGSWPSATS